ncbi:AMP-binding enzyme family protein [Mycobacterium intracellulare]|nr:AMP-binding enzyme family protein [Mycobacterium intracellulare]
MPSTIDELVRFRARHDADTPMVIDPTSRLSYRELDSTTRELAAVFVEAGVGKGSRVGLIMPNGTRWVQIAVALTRIGAVLVPLSTLLQAGELVAQLRVAAVQFLVSVEEFRGHRYLDDLKAVPESEIPALQQVWSTDQLDSAPASDRARRIIDAMTETVTPADALVIMFTSGSSGSPKGVLHSHGNALGAVQSGLAARCISGETRLYLPMPFFWVGGFGSGILSVLLAGATLVTEELPRPETTLRLLERERVTLFRGWPDQAEALARHAGSVGVDLSALRPGSLEALLPPEQRARPGRARDAVRHDRGIRAVLRLPRRHGHARHGVGQLRKAVSRHGSPHRGPRKRYARRDGNRRHDPDPWTAHAAGHLRAPARRALHPRRLLFDR